MDVGKHLQRFPASQETFRGQVDTKRPRNGPDSSAILSPYGLNLAIPVPEYGRVATHEAWLRLANEVRERRNGLGLTQEEVRAAGGPGTVTMGRIEGALQDSYTPAILRRLEDALHWKRGSVRAILGGGVPVPAEDVPGIRSAVIAAAPLPFPDAPQDGQEVRAALHMALAAVNAPLREVVLAEARAGIPFTDPVERAIWESPGWSAQEKATEIANFRARRAELGASRSAEAG